MSDPVDCINAECAWFGDRSEAVHPKHDPDFICCPECHERVYPTDRASDEVEPRL